MFIASFMAQADQVELDTAIRMASVDQMNNETKIFKKYQDSMSSNLMTSWLDVANHAVTIGLIVMKPIDIQHLPRRVIATKLFEELI